MPCQVCYLSLCHVLVVSQVRSAPRDGGIMLYHLPALMALVFALPNVHLRDSGFWDRLDGNIIESSAGGVTMVRKHSSKYSPSIRGPTVPYLCQIERDCTVRLSIVCASLARITRGEKSKSEMASM
ncbi:hypothetical protein EV424DRAFT_651303 [Suillus variegatus]|nr:hypothetical protein EV424DRAFT_651303 [Suillus variegatus]